MTVVTVVQRGKAAVWPCDFVEKRGQEELGEAAAGSLGLVGVV
jgi:hypothetical protein